MCANALLSARAAAAAAAHNEILNGEHILT
jgi:hypothetical protein